MLLHGFPQTHLMWRSIAPLLARRIFSDFASAVHELWTGFLGSSAAVTQTNASRKIAGRHACKWVCASKELGKNSGCGTYRIVYAHEMAAFSYIEGYDEG